jgi:hypothetical protein
MGQIHIQWSRSPYVKFFTVNILNMLVCQKLLLLIQKSIFLRTVNLQIQFTNVCIALDKQNNFFLHITRVKCFTEIQARMEKCTQLLRRHMYVPQIRFLYQIVINFIHIRKINNITVAELRIHKFCYPVTTTKTTIGTHRVKNMFLIKVIDVNKIYVLYNSQTPFRGLMATLYRNR